MTQVIEIVVIGAVGSGKSHVLDVIARALRGTYGVHAQITSHELSVENNLGHELTKSRLADTVFNLREHGELSRTVSEIGAIRGEALTLKHYPLELAIQSTARVLRDEHEHLAVKSMNLSLDVPFSPVYKRMSAHLEALLSQQLKRASVGAV